MSQKYTLHANGPERGQVLANAIAFLQRLPLSKSWKIEVKEARKERTLSQCNAMFGVAYAAIMEATGLEGDAEKEQLHRNFCGDFFGWIDKPMLGRVPMRTTTRNERGERDVIDTAAMARFYEFIQRQVAEYGIDCPSPDPLWFRAAA